MRTRSDKRRGFALFGTCFVLIVIGLAGREARRIILDSRCFRQLEAFYEIVCVDHCLVPRSELDASFHGKRWPKCAACGRAMVYRPFSGPVRRFGPQPEREEKTTLRMIAWCPKSAHRGRRFVLLENGEVISLSDAEFTAAAEANFLVNRNRISK